MLRMWRSGEGRACLRNLPALRLHGGRPVQAAVRGCLHVAGRDEDGLQCAAVHCGGTGAGGAAARGAGEAQIAVCGVAAPGIRVRGGGAAGAQRGTQAAQGVCAVREAV